MNDGLEQAGPVLALGAGGAGAAGVILVILVGVELAGEADLLEVVDANDLAGFLLGGAQGGQEHAGENADDCDDDEEFDQREG